MNIHNLTKRSLQPLVDSVRALTDLGAAETPDLMAYPMRKHGIADEAATLHLYRLMLDFWKANL